MSRIANRPFFSANVLVIAAAVIAGAWLLSQGLASALLRLFD